jgi:hypothetical protein
MTPNQAQLRVEEIIERLTRMGLTAPPHVPFTLRGGQLRAGPHPEYAAHWTVFWEPTRSNLRPIDLEEFSVDAAAEQVARYAAPAYLDVRRRLEDFLTALQGRRSGRSRNITPRMRSWSGLTRSRSAAAHPDRAARARS